MYRCSKCRARNALARPPQEYTRLPNCRGCGRKMTAFPTFRTEPHFTLDNYRRTHERGSRVRKCYPGRGGCDEYPFPHRHGSGWCRYNSRVTCEERMKREGVEG